MFVVPMRSCISQFLSYNLAMCSNFLKCFFTVLFLNPLCFHPLTGTAVSHTIHLQLLVKLYMPSQNLATASWKTNTLGMKGAAIIWFLQYLLLSGSSSTTDPSSLTSSGQPTLQLVAQISFATCPSPRLSSPTTSFLCTLITDALVCSQAKRALLASLRSWKPPIFCTFFLDKISHIHACIPEEA